jgi:hypothetical protein
MKDSFVFYEVIYLNTNYKLDGQSKKLYFIFKKEILLY